LILQSCQRSTPKSRNTLVKDRLGLGINETFVVVVVDVVVKGGQQFVNDGGLAVNDGRQDLLLLMMQS